MEELGRVTTLEWHGGAFVLRVQARKVLEGARAGDSIAVNGVCLTVRETAGGGFTADVMPETARVTSLGRLRPGDPVNLERALRLGDRLGGHLVTGHVDGVGEVLGRQPLDNAFILDIAAPPQVARYLVPRGSVAVDGVSLTVVSHTEDGFRVSIIPHTAESTTLGRVRRGDPVNLEADLVGKYVARLLEPHLAARGGSAHDPTATAAGGGGPEAAGQPAPHGSGAGTPPRLTREFLAEHGFSSKGAF